jgi:TRAP-type mannitol/chloroaromatic compound transport system substrate-binding protein
MAESELILLLSNKILTDKAELAQLELKNERLQFESRTKLIHRYVALYKYLNEMLQKAREKNKDLLEKSKENRRDLQKMVLDSLNPVFNDENG